MPGDGGERTQGGSSNSQNNTSVPAGYYRDAYGNLVKIDNSTQAQSTSQATQSSSAGTTSSGSSSSGNAPGTTGPIQIVAGEAQGENQVNVADSAGYLAANPEAGMTDAMKLSKQQTEIDANTAGTTITAPQNYQIEKPIAQTGQTATASQVDPRQAATYEAQQTQAQVAQNQMTAAQGQVSAGTQITAPQVDMKGTATGTNADGSTNYTGQALNKAAQQDISNIIDTSTPSGKALAQALGEGNYTDSKATMKGQLDILQSEFVGPNGEPKIPGWAAATARSVSKIAAFKGMTGTAATAAMSQALMEASIPIAQQDANFFQTLTVKNLDNRQESTINKANVLAKFDLANLDARMTAAVENSKAFLAMDLANLSNEQQARVINNQSRIQSIFEDAKSVNAQRLYSADAANDMTKFYDTLNTTVSQFNASQNNAMSQFNAGEQNSMQKFNVEMEDSRDKFYKEMQYNVDLANAKWRQTVTLENDRQQYEAAAADVKTAVGIQSEALNRLWDRSDSLLDYAWQSSEKEKDRATEILVAKMTAQMQLDAEDSKALGAILGSLAGNSDVIDKLLSLFD